MQTLLSQVRYRRFPNRVIRQSPPSVGRVSQGDGDSFASRIVIETQPEPVAEGVSINAVVLDVGGWSLVCAGYAILLYSVEPFGPLLPLLIDGLAAVMAITIGGRLLARGDRLHEVFRFESDIVAISLTGTYTVSGIGLGDGRGGQLYSQRSSLQSDTHVSVLGARLLTECSPIDGRSALEAPRAVLDSAVDPEFERRIEHVLAGMREFEDTAGRLAGIDLSAPAVEQIVSANAQIQQAAASSQRLEGPPAMASLELLGHADEDADEWKVCPDCGETIREVARKCRFCDFRYGADEPEGVAVDGVECPEATSR
jgi:hypothetical protein